MSEINYAIQLESLATESDFAEQSGALVESWVSAGVGRDAVRPILQFMEEHPTIDFGLPGPLVHFTERFYGNGYEQELLLSIQRRPTQHTVWMLNRLINGTRDGATKRQYIAVLESANKIEGADQNTRAKDRMS
jgi:hypothetical protein